MDTAKKEVIFVLQQDYADWEFAHAASALNKGIIPSWKSKYSVKILSINKDPVSSIGGLRALPDYDINSLPEDYAALILVGGMTWRPNWRSPEAEQIYPLVQNAINKNRVVGAICDATVFLGVYGFLNKQKHTSNTLEDLKTASGENYTGEQYYQHEQAVRDGNIVTANGTAYMEFTRELLYALDADTAENIELFYQFYKDGYYKTIKKAGMSETIV